MKIFKAQQIRFLCEQDGNVERDLKQHLVALLRQDIRVRKAYLARLRYEPSAEAKVALCVSEDGVDRNILVANVSTAFRKMFKTTEILDIIFLSGEQESEVANIAKPFYEQIEHKV